MSALIHNVKVTSALDYTSGSADRNGATLDMKEFEGVLVVVKFAAIATNATTSIKMQSGDASDMSDAADLTGTSVSVADDDDDEVKYLDLYQPRERYVRVVVDKDASNVTAESAVYIQYGSKSGPTTQPTGVEGEAHQSPAEGTA